MKLEKRRPKKTDEKFFTKLGFDWKEIDDLPEEGIIVSIAIPNKEKNPEDSYILIRCASIKDGQWINRMGHQILGVKYWKYLGE